MLLRIWPLFAGIFLIASSNALQNTLLGLRAELESFATPVTGLVMASYFLGVIVSSYVAPWIIQRVGHVRAFGAMSALASMTILLHAVFVEPVSWFVMRFLTGFALSGIWVLAESWLNQLSRDRFRGRIMSLYMTVVFVGLSVGQLLINLSAPGGFDLFVLVSLMISFAAIPILLTPLPTPRIKRPKPAPLFKVLKWAPMSTLAMFIISMAFASSMTMGALYGAREGMSVAQISLFIASLLGGGIVFQWPLGRLADAFDRRLMTGLFAMAGTVLGVISALGHGDYLDRLLLAFLFGGCVFPLQALATAMINDNLSRDRTLAVSAKLSLVRGVGASMGPVLVALAMDHWGPPGFFWTLSGLSGLVGIGMLVRFLWVSDRPGDERQVFEVRVPYAMGLGMNATDSHPKADEDAEEGSH